MLDILLDIPVALGFAGCIYGIARVLGRRLDFRRVAGWTAAVMFAIAAYGQLSIASSGEATPNVSRVIPIMIFAIVMLRVRRRAENDDPVLDVSEPQVAS